MPTHAPTDRRTLVIFGAGGDLTRRYLLPALARLAAADELPAHVRVRGVAMVEQSDDDFRSQVAAALAEHAPDVPAEVVRGVVERCDYRCADVTVPADVAAAVEGTGSWTAYLALPPAVFGPAITALAATDPPSDAAVVVEKPFGADRESARELNALLARGFPEERVFRVDHFLAKQTVQNVLGLRFANRVLEPLWNAHHVESVDIVWDETLRLEGRASYYDRAGALQDMVQNHLVQILCLVAMEPPASLSQRDLRDAKIAVLRAVRDLDEEGVRRWSRRARYAAPESGPGVAYADEPGVDPARGTETYAELVLHVDTWRWAGTPFRLRSGKGLGERVAYVEVRFRPVPHLAFDDCRPPEQNRLVLGLDPDRIELHLAINGPGDPFALDPVTIGTELAPQDLPAYARLLRDVLEVDPVLSIRGDEAEEAWRIVDPVVRAWRAGAVPLEEYAAGSAGPPRLPLR